MNKIICEICGTVYPESSPVCPICGYHRAEGDQVERVTEEAGAEPVRKTQSVKGGRFSARNVKKRHKEQAKLQKQSAGRAAQAKTPQPEPEYDEEYDEPRKSSNRGLIITIVVLLIAIVLVSAYIAIRFFNGSGGFGSLTQPSEDTAASSEESTEPSSSEVLCSDLVIADIDLEKGLEFTGEGRAMELSVTAVPVSTTETVTYTTSDENVVTISEDSGIVQLVSVGPGEATVTVTCGSVSRSFPVQCSFGEATEPSTEPTEETTEATEEPTEATTEPADESLTLKLNRSDITFYTKGESFTFSAGSGIKNSQVLWTSADESIAKIENGKVTAVGKGTTTITAEYNGKKQTCIVRCSISDSEEDTTGSGAWKISHTDVSITVGETFSLRLKNSDGTTAEVSWSVSGDAASVSGNTVKGESAGTVTVSCTHEGQTYECIVRVSG